MKNKYIILLITLLICYNSYAKNLQNIRLTEDASFNNIPLESVCNILTNDFHKTILADSETKNLPIDLSFPKGENGETLLQAICEIYNLNIKNVGNTYLFTKKIKNITNFNLYGNVKSLGYDEGVDGVKVSLVGSDSLPAYTQSGGKYVISDIEPGVYILRFEKKGYSSYGELVNIDKNRVKVDVALKKIFTFRKNTKKDDNTIIKDLKNNIITKKIILNGENGKEIKEILTENFDNMLRISLLPKQNILILTGTPQNIQNASALISEIDKDLKQIQISSQILDVSNNVFENLGFTWIYNHGKNSSQNDLNVGILDASSLSGAGNIFTSGAKVTKLFNSGSDVLNLGINMLESTQDLVVSARPTILVVNGEEGEFKVTEEVIVGEKTHQNDKTERTTTTPIFKEAGIILKVTPHIKEHNIIILDIMIEVSNFKLHYSDDGSGGTYNSKGGSKITRQIKTKIKVKDGQTIFIGGLKKAIVRNLNSKIPVFGTLPLIKYLFKNEDVSHEMSDIYIKLKVNMVDDNKNSEFEKDEIHEKVDKIRNNRIF